MRDIDVLGMACCCWDLLATVERYAELDEKVAISDMVQQGGGQAATAMAAVAKLGGRAAIAGRIGDDDLGEHILQALHEAGVGTNALKVSAGATSQFAICMVHQATGKRSIFWKRGSAGSLEPGDIDEDLVRRASVLLIDSSSVEAGIRAATLARELGRPVVVDIEKPDPGNERLLRLATHPILPIDYGIALTGESRPLDLCRAVQRMGPGHVVVTLGERGCVAVERDRVHRLRAHQDVPVVDTTGAGDAFHGAFAYGLALGKSLEDNLRFASAAATLCCRALGGRAGLATREEVEALTESDDLRAARRPAR